MIGVDPYGRLMVGRGAEDREIVLAYRRAALVAHPDCGGGRDDFEVLKMCRDILLDPARRAHYDRTGEMVDAEADNKIARRMALYGAAVDGIFEELSGISGGMAGKLNMVEMIGRWLRGRVKFLRGEEVRLAGSLALNRGLLGRFRTGGAVNLLEDLVRGRVREFEARCRLVEREIVDVEGALSGLSDYWFEGVGFWKS